MVEQQTDKRASRHRPEPADSASPLWLLARQLPAAPFPGKAEEGRSDAALMVEVRRLDLSCLAIYTDKLVLTLIIRRSEAADSVSKAAAPSLPDGWRRLADNEPVRF